MQSDMIMCLLLQAGQTAVFTVTTTQNVTYFYYQVRNSVDFALMLHMIIIQTSILNSPVLDVLGERYYVTFASWHEPSVCL